MTEPPSRQFEAYEANGWPNEVAEYDPHGVAAGGMYSQRRLLLARVVRPEPLVGARHGPSFRLRHGRLGRQHARHMRRVAVAGSA